MKKFLLVICFFALGVYQSFAQCTTQYTYLTSQEQVDEFLVLNPTCTEIENIIIDQGPSTPITNLNAFQNIVSVEGDLKILDSNLTSLAGLDNITAIGGELFLQTFGLTDISALSNVGSVGGSVEIVAISATDFSPLNNIEEIGANFLLQIGGMPEVSPQSLNIDLSLQTIPGDLVIQLPYGITDVDGLDSITSVGGDLTFEAYVTDVSGLGNLETVGGGFFLGGIMMEQMDGFESLVTIGGLFNIVGTNSSQITGFNNLESVGALYFAGCLLLEGMPGFSSLEEINGGHLQIHNCDLLVSLDGFESLTSLNMSGIFLQNNYSLTDISALQYIDPFSITSVQLSNNMSLSECSIQSFCNYLQSPGAEFGFYNNAAGCNSQEEVTEGCASTTNTLTGLVTSNFLTDSCGDPEYGIAGAQVTVADAGGQEYITYTQPDGTYTLYVPAGSYAATVTINNFTEVQAGPFIFEGAGDETEVPFCITDNSQVDDVKVTIYPVNEARPGFDAVYAIVCENVGTTAQSGAVSFVFDEDKLDVLSAEPATTATAPGELGWNFSLNPFQSQTYTVTMNILPPEVNNNDDVLVFTATVPTTGDATPDDNTNMLNQVLVGSYDPNDKTVMEGEEILIGNAGEFLTYRIRFQNTGTASAINIRLEDELESGLDLATFEPVATSHPDYRVELIDNILKVYFDGIELPAQQDDDAGSNGFFMFRIKPVGGMEVGDEIANTAGIYFDFNPPIITNTATIEFVTPASTGKNEVSRLSMFPNPARSVVHFRGDSPIVNVMLYNSLGQQVASHSAAEGITQMDIAHLAAGLYMCHTADAEGRVSVQKLMINK